MIFSIGEYISSAVYGNTIATDNNGIVTGANHYLAFAVQMSGIASLFCMMFFYKKLSENFRLSNRLSLPEQEDGLPYLPVSSLLEYRQVRQTIKNSGSTKPVDNMILK